MEKFIVKYYFGKEDYISTTMTGEGQANVTEEAAKYLNRWIDDNNGNPVYINGNTVNYIKVLPEERKSAIEKPDWM